MLIPARGPVHGEVLYGYHGHDAGSHARLAGTSTHHAQQVGEEAGTFDSGTSFLVTMFGARFVILAAATVPFVVSQNASNYVVDLGYTKYQGVLNQR